MKISVITAVYNAESTISQAIESVAAQSYKNIEHVIVEGNSTDGSLAVIKKNMNDKILLISEPDNGIYDALNKGIQRSSGDIVGLVHADDYLAHNDVFDKIAKAFFESAVEAVYGDLQYVSKDDTSRVVRHWRSHSYSRAKLARGWMPPHPTLFLKRSVFEQTGLYNTSFQIAADYDLILRYFSQTLSTPVYIPEVLVKMRLGGESNRSLPRILQKMREDYRALRENRVGGIAALAAKNLSKLPQFWDRKK